VDVSEQAAERFLIKYGLRPERFPKAEMARGTMRTRQNLPLSSRVPSGPRRAAYANSDGCGGLQPSELVNSAVPVRVNPYGCLTSVNDAMNFFPQKRASAFLPKKAQPLNALLSVAYRFSLPNSLPSVVPNSSLPWPGGVLALVCLI
jgi:hypothetical protein